MNLLFDKREQSSQSGPVDHNSQDDVMFHSEESGTLTGGKKPKIEKLKKPKKQMKIGWFYVFLVPLSILVLVMAYIFYFQRDLLFKPKVPTTISQKQFTVIDSTTQEQPGDQNIQEPTTTETITQQQVVQEQPTSQTQSQMDQVVQQTTQPATTRQSGADGQQHVAIQLVAEILGKLPSNLTLSSLFVDENSFSVGVSTSSSSALNGYYQNLSASLPAGAAITTEPKLARNQALIAGTYTVAPTRGNKIPVSSANIKSNIGSIIQKNNVQRLEITLGAPKTWNNIKRVQVFVKISGQYSNCQNVIQEILSSGWDISLSKIIVMPVNATRGTMVLRFFLNNPA